MRPHRFANLLLNTLAILSLVLPTSSVFHAVCIIICLGFSEAAADFLSAVEWLRSLSCIFVFFFPPSVSGWFSLCLQGAHCFAFCLQEKSEFAPWSTCKHCLPPWSTVRGNQARRQYFLTLCGLTGAWAQTEVTSTQVCSSCVKSQPIFTVLSYQWL